MLNTAWTLVLLTWFVTLEVIVVGFLYHLFIVFSVILFCKLLRFVHGVSDLQFALTCTLLGITQIKKEKKNYKAFYEIGN